LYSHGEFCPAQHRHQQKYAPHSLIPGNYPEASLIQLFQNVAPEIDKREKDLPIVWTDHVFRKDGQKIILKHKKGIKPTHR
jgi:hypothetical protein